MNFLRLGTTLTHHLVCRLLVKDLQPIHVFTVYLVSTYYVPGTMLSDGYRVLNEEDEEEVPTPGDAVVI